MAGEGSSPALNAGGGRYLAFLYSYLAFINICICFFLYLYIFVLLFIEENKILRQFSQTIQSNHPAKALTDNNHKTTSKNTNKNIPRQFSKTIQSNHPVKAFTQMDVMRRESRFTIMIDWKNRFFWLCDDKHTHFMLIVQVH